MVWRTGSIRSPSSGHLTLVQAVDLFLAAKAAEHISPKTSAWYRMILARFGHAFDPGRPVDGLSAPEIRAWLLELDDEVYGPGGGNIAPIAEAWRRIWSFLAEDPTVLAFGPDLPAARGRDVEPDEHEQAARVDAMGPRIPHRSVAPAPSSWRVVSGIGNVGSSGSANVDRPHVSGPLHPPMAGSFISCVRRSA